MPYESAVASRQAGEHAIRASGDGRASRALSARRHPQSSPDVRVRIGHRYSGGRSKRTILVELGARPIFRRRWCFAWIRAAASERTSATSSPCSIGLPGEGCRSPNLYGWKRIAGGFWISVHRVSPHAGRGSRRSDRGRVQKSPGNRACARPGVSRHSRRGRRHDRGPRDARARRFRTPSSCSSIIMIGGPNESRFPPYHRGRLHLAAAQPRCRTRAGDRGPCRRRIS